MSHSFELIPRDVLFLRDARPMEASDAGLGANWPRPDQLYNALHNALIDKWPELQEWESADGNKHTFRDKNLPEHRGASKDRNADSSFRFGALAVCGPFPKKGDKLYLPCPLDWGMRPVRCGGTDLPAPLTHAFLPVSREKASLPRWVPQELYREYLRGGVCEMKRMQEKDVRDADLYGADRNIGIALHPDSGTTIPGKLYQAEYLRLQEGVTLAFEAECPVKQRKGAQITDALDEARAPGRCVFGGQRGIARMAELPGGPVRKAFEGLAAAARGSFEAAAAGGGAVFLRWTLLAPALFNAGWRPGWVDAGDGSVLLPRVRVERRPGERRAEWKARQNAAGVFGGSARLVAARVGKPAAFSGWDLRAGGPKPTRLAVPAGSSYVFRCEGIGEAKALADVLNIPNRRSDIFGEKGFGIGICSLINLND